MTIIKAWQNEDALWRQHCVVQCCPSAKCGNIVARRADARNIQEHFCVRHKCCTCGKTSHDLGNTITSALLPPQCVLVLPAPAETLTPSISVNADCKASRLTLNGSLTYDWDSKRNKYVWDESRSCSQHLRERESINVLSFPVETLLASKPIKVQTSFFF